MHKVKKLFLFLIPIICGDLGAACVSNDHNKVLIEEGSLINKDQPEIKFKSAVFELDKYLLEGVTFNTCEDDSSWEIAADKAVLEDDVLSISNAKVKLYNIPIFWLGNISLDKDKEINIPNFGITDSNFDFSYKFEGGNENAMFTLEPIYTKSKFGVSLKAKFDDGMNKTSFQSFAIDDNESSWVFKINSLVKITEDLELTVDYADLSGNSLIENYGYKFLDINRRTLDLEKNLKLSWHLNNRLILIGQESFENLNLPRPVTHTKNFIKYSSFYNLDNWKVRRITEVSNFKIKNNVTLLKKISPPNEGADFPYFVYQDVERKNRRISFSNNSLFTGLNSKLDVEIFWKEYKIKNQTDSKNISHGAFQIRQIFKPTYNLSLGYIWSSFKDDGEIPLLDSFPKSQNPENNISMSPWYGDDRSGNQRKVFIYYTNSFGGIDFSVSTNLYEDYFFSNLNSELQKYFEKDPIFYSFKKSFGDSEISAEGNYNYKDNSMTSSTFEFQNTNESREFSLSKKRYLNTSFPLNDLDNYVLKFSQRFDNFTFFARTQYSVENKSVNENIVGAEWYKDCFKFRLAFERARFFPFTEADYSKGNYFDQIYLTNPILKNNLSFEFELIGLTNPLKPINTLIQNGLFN